jgi:DNA-binding Lrp family transcriptional regulator
MTDPHTHDTAPQGATEGAESRQERTFSEEFRVSGEAVLAKVRELVREGNVRRITIKNEEGRSLIEIPLTIGVIGTVLLPVWAAIGAIAALVANLTIAVERVRPVEQPDPATTDLHPSGDTPA